MKKITLLLSAMLFSVMSFATVITFDADVDKGNAGTDSNNAAAYTITKDGVTVTVSSGILGTYNNEMHYRIYKNQTLTVTSTVGNVTSVEFTCTANDDAKYGPGCFTWSTGNYTYSGAKGTWSGSASEIVFTASSNQVRATQVVVTIDGEGGNEGGDNNQGENENPDDDDDSKDDNDGDDDDNDNPGNTDTPSDAITFDADVDKGNASLDSSNQTPYSVSKGGVTLDVTKGIIGAYNNENHYRIYKSETLTITSTVGNIVSVEFTCTAKDDEKYGPGCFTWSTGDYSYSGAVGTWTGNATSVEFFASTNQVRASQIVVKVATTTGVEDVIVVEMPVKVIQNGQVLIKRGENVYNLVGVQVK